MHKVSVLILGIIIAGLAVVTLYAVAKRRTALMIGSNTVMAAILGVQQFLEGQPRWPAYVSFSAAGVGLVSLMVQRRRKQRT